MRDEVPRKRGRPRKAKPLEAPQGPTIAQFMPAQPDYILVPKAKVKDPPQVSASDS